MQPQRKTPEQVAAALRKDERLFDGLVLALTAAVVLASMLLSPSADAVSIGAFPVPELCLFRRLTGHGCPGCGLTRSFTFMGHAMLLEAFHLHKLGPPLYLFVAAQVPWRAWKLLRR